MEFSVQKRRRILLVMGIAAALIYGIDSLILWLDLVLQTDVLYEGSLLWRVLGWRDAIFTMFGFAVLFGCTISSLYNFGLKHSIPTLVLVPALLIGKYVLQSFFILLQNDFNLFGFLIYQMPSTLFSLLIQFLQWALITSVSACAIYRSPNRLKLPFILTALLSTIIRIVIRMVGDIQYGAPTSAGDLLYMIAAYTCDILLYGILLYIGMRYIKKTAEKSAVFFIVVKYFADAKCEIKCLLAIVKYSPMANVK